MTAIIVLLSSLDAAGCCFRMFWIERWWSTTNLVLRYELRSTQYMSMSMVLDNRILWCVHARGGYGRVRGCMLSSCTLNGSDFRQFGQVLGNLERFGQDFGGRFTRWPRGSHVRGKCCGILAVPRGLFVLHPSSSQQHAPARLDAEV